MCMTRMCPVTTDIICHGHESYVSRIIFRVKEFEEKKFQLGLKYLWTEENIFHVTGNILCHGHDLIYIEMSHLI